MHGVGVFTLKLRSSPCKTYLSGYFSLLLSQKGTIASTPKAGSGSEKSEESSLHCALGKHGQKLSGPQRNDLNHKRHKRSV